MGQIPAGITHSRSLYNHMGTCGVDVIRRFYGTNPCWYQSLYNLMGTCDMDLN